VSAEPLQIALLVGAAFVAGMVNSIAGGGTLFTFPALVGIGVAPLTANGSSTVALVPGSAAAVAGYWRETVRSRRGLLFIVPSLAGGVLGAALSLRAGDAVFGRVVPWLILGATVLFLVQERLARGRKVAPTPAGGARLALLLAAQLAISVYGGFFGAGMGILMLSVFAAAGLSDVHEMNGVKSLAAVCINGTAALTFIATGRVVWLYAGIMSVAAIAGGYAGAVLARRAGQARVRKAIVVCGFALAAAMFVRMY
jgi:uncharacterized membrane protein YfcA